jgi:hypothetical protein
MCFSGEIQPRCQPIVGTYHSLSATHIELAHQRRLRRKGRPKGRRHPIAFDTTTLSHQWFPLVPERYLATAK